jgi:hypothetical protein
MCPLSSHRQGTAMTQSTVATDVHQSFDVHLDPLAQVSFNFTLRFQDCPDLTQFVLIQVGDASIMIHARLVQNGTRSRTTDTVDIRESNFSSFIWWKVDASYTCHFLLIALRFKNGLHGCIPNLLSLPLFVFGVDANHPHHALAMDDFALVAHLFY